MRSESVWLEGLARSSKDWDERAIKAIEELGDDQLNWRPNRETWSVYQQFHHLLLANRPYIDILERLAEDANPYRRDYRPGFWGKFMLLAVGPEEKMPGPVPRPLIPSEGPMTRDVVNDFQSVQGRFHEVLAKAMGRDLTERFSSPFAKFVRLQLGDALHITERHNARHLGKAIRLLDRPDFPH